MDSLTLVRDALIDWLANGLVQTTWWEVLLFALLATQLLHVIGLLFAGGLLLSSQSGTPLQSVNLASTSALTVSGNAMQLTLNGAVELVLGGGTYGAVSLSSGRGMRGESTGSCEG